MYVGRVSSRYAQLRVGALRPGIKVTDAIVRQRRARLFISSHEQRRVRLLAA